MCCALFLKTTNEEPQPIDISAAEKYPKEKEQINKREKSKHNI